MINYNVYVKLNNHLFVTRQEQNTEQISVYDDYGEFFINDSMYELTIYTCEKCGYETYYCTDRMPSCEEIIMDKVLK